MINEINIIWSYCQCDGERHNFIEVNGRLVCEKCKKPLMFAIAKGTNVTQQNMNELVEDAIRT